MRLLLFALMFASLIVSATLPEAFADRGLVFAAAFTAMQVARPLFAALNAPRNHHLRGRR